MSALFSNKITKYAADPNKYNVVVHYQPIFDNKTKNIHQYEALMRLSDGEEILYPDCFMRHACEYGLYDQLSLKMLSIVFENLKMHKNLAVAINISMTDIKNIGFCRFLFAEIRSIQDPNRITFEIIETDKMNLARATAFLNELKKTGAKVSIDDFGTGYSNFENLLFFNFDYLKIDGKFIKNLHDEKCTSVVNTILKYCKENKIKMVAEHIENEAVLKQICSMGIEYSQGFYLAKPRPLVNLI